MPNLSQLVYPQWKPLEVIQTGWDALTVTEQAEVASRVHAVDRTVKGPIRHTRVLFGLLAQVETIAIEIPRRFLPSAPAELQPQLRQQLVDEVFHSTLFARIAHELDGPGSSPNPPLQSAEALLTSIRALDNLPVSAAVLNLIAEGWIENLFKHASTWGVADDVFKTVLADETRHVTEAVLYGIPGDSAEVAAAIKTVENGLIAVMQEPQLSIALLELAGEENYSKLVKGLYQVHREHLAEIGLTPSAEWLQMEQLTGAAITDISAGLRATPIPDTPWKQSARRLWNTPRDPTMQGDFDLNVQRVPKRLLTPVLIAALGRAWAKHPELNRIVQGDRIWQLPRANVGVRVLVREGELATVVIPDADKRSVRDISRMLIEGVQRLQSIRDTQDKSGKVTLPFDDSIIGGIRPNEYSFSIALSNPGKFGLIRGAGSLCGEFSPSSDMSVGRRQKLPVWKGIGYFPEWHVNLGCLQDHRVFDGREAGLAMSGLAEQLSEHNLKKILTTKDSLPSEEEWNQLLKKHEQNSMGPMGLMAQVGIAKYVPYIAGGVAIGAGAGTLLYMLATQAKGVVEDGEILEEIIED